MATVEITLDVSKIDGYLRGKLDERGGQVVRKVAFDVQGTAQTLCPKDTSACANSIYVRTFDFDGFQAAAGAASAARPGVANHVLPEPQHELQAVIGPSVEYGVWVELIHNAFLTPAVELHRGSFERAWGELFK